MNKYLTALLLLVLTATAAKAQPEPGTTTIYPRLGFNLSKFAGDEIYVSDDGDPAKSKYKFGVTAGAEAEYQFTRFFAASAGLLYSMQGTSYDEKNRMYARAGLGIGLERKYWSLRFDAAHERSGDYTEYALSTSAQWRF